MPRGVHNWTFRDVEHFLKEHGFHLNDTNGSHYYYICHIGGVLRNVCAPFHSSKSIKSRTLKGIILQSGISQKEWLEY